MLATRKHKKYTNLINICEAKMQEFPVTLPIKHIFTDGVYIREIFIPKGIWLTSRIHLTEHPYIVSMGVINICTVDGLVKIIAPYTGINKAGTRRLGVAVEDCIWSAIFPNPDNCEDLSIIEKRLFGDYDNPLLSFKNKEAIV